jgi:TonB-dependent SusC/RagA subfamily outer membrane receptor
MGYGKVLNKNKTSSSSQIEYNDETRNPGFANIYEMISGRIPGVQVIGGNKIIIRGVKTLMGGTDPLFVVDGTVRNSIDDIPPSQVKSISVLKDGSAAVYGSRGANGVILINTK